MMDLRGALIRNIFYPLAQWCAGDGAELRWLREFERTQFSSADDLRMLQEQRLRELLAHAYSNCPFYRERFDDAGISPQRVRSLDDVPLLPILEKADIQQQGQLIIAQNWPKDDLVANCTGGSTGTPLKLGVNRDRLRSRSAATLRHNSWAGWNVGDRVAILWGAPRDRPSSGWKSLVRRTLLRQPLWLDTGHITEDRLFEFHLRMLHYRPKIIQAYARSAYLAACYLESSGLRPHRPQAIITSAEMLEPRERAVIERVFGCEVFDRYGCREVSVIASECPAHSGLHVMAEGLYVEIVRDGRPVRPGEMGDVLVTDLFNYGMPLIRYRIGDVASWAAGNCSCGRHLPRLERVHGRATDFLVGSDGRLVSGSFLSLYVVGSRPSLGQVQIVQERAGEVLFRIRPGHDFVESADLAYLENAAREHLGESINVRHELVERMSAEASGKFLFSRSAVAPAFLHTASAWSQTL